MNAEQEVVDVESTTLGGCRLVIIKDSIKETALAKTLTALLSAMIPVKTSLSSTTDFLFSYSFGSFAVSFYSTFDEEILQSMLKMQQSSMRSYAIFRDLHDEAWARVQQDLPGGSGKLNILRSESIEESIDIVIGILSVIPDVRKTEQQVEYFRREYDLTISIEKGIVIAQGIMTKINIGASAQEQLLSQGIFPSLAAFLRGEPSLMAMQKQNISNEAHSAVSCANV
jgi:hypothetical protein